MSECDPIDVCCIASLVCLSLGIIFSGLGLVINIDYKIDVDIPASDMERTERYYHRLAIFLHLCDIFGISMVTTGGCLLLLAVVVMATKGEFSRGPDEGGSRDARKQKSPLLPGSSMDGDRRHGYGSNDPNQTKGK